ncbi:MAG: Tm-1-like ATP-binding domain-containing protein [Pirellulales bacterium]
MRKPILIIGTFDTKGAEYAFLREQIITLGGEVLTVNVGVLGSSDLFPVDIETDEVVRETGADLASLRQERDRGKAIKIVSQAAAAIVSRLYDEGQFAGIIGMGGSGGSTVVTSAMRALPYGVPKVCVSTVAGGDTSPYVGAKDVTMIPAITDVAGVNRISRTIFTRAAGAVVGMVAAVPPTAADDRPIIVASMFGNTTECVDACREKLAQTGYEVLVFHATGNGGQTMESLIDEGMADACLDITTTEWADEICGGMLSAGNDRLSAAGRAGIPHLIVPGCVDMVNFGPMHTVPQQFKDAGRLFYEWNPSVTLMRTNVDENRRLGEIFAGKANAATGPVAILLPLRGVSILDGDGQSFCDRQADRAMFKAIRDHADPQVPIFELDANINDTAFSDRAVEVMLDLISQTKCGRQ